MTTFTSLVSSNLSCYEKQANQRTKTGYHKSAKIKYKEIHLNFHRLLFLGTVNFKHKYIKPVISVTGVTRRMPLEEQELLTLPKHMSSPPGFSGVHDTKSLVLCVVFSWSLFVLLFFFFRSFYCVFFYFTDSDHLLVSSNPSYVMGSLRAATRCL